MSKWTGRDDISFSSSEFSLNVSRIDDKQKIAIEGKGQIFLDNCPYFVDANSPTCYDDSGAHECIPFSESNCRLYGLIKKVDLFQRGKSET